jgi:hypothetical protein
LELPRVDNTMVKALSRAYRWKRMLESGEFVTVQDLAAAEKINPSYFSRVLRLALLGPDIIHDKAVECLIKDRDALLAFYDFPAEHWKHLRTTNPIERSAQAAQRLRFG